MDAARPAILTVVGARPQFVKAAAVSRHLRAVADEHLVHTGQHVDASLSAEQFRDLGLRAPDVILELPEFPTAGARTTHLIAELRAAIRDVRPDRVLVYGDTDSTLAGAMAAHLEGVPLAHVEAGVRSGRLAMPEEGNRIVTDHLADLLLCPVPSAATTLRAECVSGRIEVPGDVMLDTFLEREAAIRSADAPERLSLERGKYVVATLHRPENVDSTDRLHDLLDGLAACGRPVVLPAHPRGRPAMDRWAERLGTEAVRLMDPLPYTTLLSLVAHAHAVVTDSGGLQKEAGFLGTPCVTVRTETEWPETLASGWNLLLPPNRGDLRQRLPEALAATRPEGTGLSRELFGGGRAAERIAALVCPPN